MTVVNLFYKPWIYDTQPTVSQFFQRQLASPITRSTCALYGLKCENDEFCDCAKMCTNGEFVPFRIMPNESIFLMDHKLTPGTYCLPKGIGNCNQKTSYHVFSLTGWKCINRNKSLYHDETMVACKAVGAKDNEKNVLWDYLKNEPAKDIDNPYETLWDGKTLRYRCVCNSLDRRNKRMISVLPFTCSVDYCVTDIFNSLAVMGFENGKCQCGPYPHEDPDDEASPCVMEKTRIENNELVGAVRCMADNAWKKSPIFCPSQADVLSFTTPVMGGDSKNEFVGTMMPKLN